MKTFEQFLDEKQVIGSTSKITSVSKATNAMQSLKDKARSIGNPILKTQSEITLQAHKNLKQQMTNKKL